LNQEKESVKKMPSLLIILFITIVFVGSDGFQPRLSFLATNKNHLVAISFTATEVGKRRYKNTITARKLNEKGVTSPERERRQIAVDTDYFVQKNTADTRTTTKQTDVVPRQDKNHRGKSVQIYGDISNIDPITVTALLFTALAVNFIIFAHWEDSGLSKLVARFINTVS
jgi:hypothetical protein